MGSPVKIDCPFKVDFVAVTAAVVLAWHIVGQHKTLVQDGEEFSSWELPTRLS